MRRPRGSKIEFLRAAAAATTDECMPIEGPRRPRATLDGRQMNASRAVWILAHGDPGDAFVLHRCHNDRCVNVRHLYLGDHARNMLDMIEAGHNLRDGHAGEANGRAVLDEAAVHRIRTRAAGGESYPSIARSYGVATTTIGMIVRRQTWAHVA